MKKKQKVITGYRSRCRNAGRKEKTAVPNEVPFITGYNRKYALRILNTPQAPRTLLVVNGETVKLKPRKKKDPPTGMEKIYTGEVITSLRLIWTFFRYQCAGKCPSSPASWPAFAITPAVREKLLSISPRTRFRGGDHRPRPQKRQGRPQGQKSHQAGKIPQTPHPHPRLLHPGRAKTPRFYPN